MCSCSGNCNCNSSTIPRGPQGPQGPAATITVGDVTPLPSGSTPTVTNTGTSGAATFNFGIPAGAPGTNGAPGINAYTTLTAPFLQPNINSTIVISVANSSWVDIDQIIFIGPTTFINAGGYYRVIDIPTLTSIEIIRLDWTIPGITFRAFNTIVGATGTLVTTSGTIGAAGPTSVQRIINDQLADGIGVPANLDVNITQLNLNGEFITFNVIWNTTEGSDILNAIYFQLNNSTSPSLFYASSTDFANAGLQNALIKYDRDPGLDPTGYPNDQELNYIRGDFKITRISSSVVRVIATIYGHNTNQQNFGVSTHPQKIWTMTTSKNISNTSNFTINLIATGDGENIIQMYDILKYTTPNI